uniref:Uncharacterized protein n=1 Tax=Rhizophora mucronata TaxID=61149 RepID=A0A2P2PDJ6_RHIMU
MSLPIWVAAWGCHCADCEGPDPSLLCSFAC